MKRVTLSEAEMRAIARGQFVRVELGGWVAIGEGQHAKSAFVGQDGHTVRAYYNICQHQPVELDMPLEPGQRAPRVRRAPMAEDGVHLLCHSHGALYRPADGRCVLGPCYGASLVPVAIEESAPGEKVTLLVGERAPARPGE